MRLKIRGGTANHGDASLCQTCRFATVIKGRRLRDEIIECDRLSHGNNRITFDVSTCSGYADRRQASIREMEEIAWILRSDLKKNTVGFVKASDLKSKDRFILPDEWS
jgi:hypothetical protein